MSNPCGGIDLDQHGSGNGLLPDGTKAIAWTNADFSFVNMLFSPGSNLTASFYSV